MPSFYDDNDDLRWYIDRGIDWEPVARLTEYDWGAEDGFRSVDEALEFYREVLDLIGTFAAEQIAPRWTELDAAHPRVEGGEVIEPAVTREIFEGLAELGVHGLCLPRELGGMNAPLLIFHASMELYARADVSTGAHASFHGGMALAAVSYSVREGTTTFQTDPPRITSTRFAECIEEIAEGRAWGSMDITEPGAGSDMAALRCRGEQDALGGWTVTGQKIFITSGHGRWHFVIARTEEPVGDDALAGLAGLSLFLVPAWEWDEDGGKRWRSTVERVEDKLGHNASATVTISFDNTPAHLIGQRGEGFKLMLLLMNNARIGVGFESIGVMEAALRASRAYAAERPSMGKTIDRHELVADLLDEMDIDVRATRAMAMEAAWHEELAQKAEILLRVKPPADDAARAEAERALKRHQRKSRHLTPLLKWFGAEKAVEVTRRAVQIHGGSGYMKEYRVEKLLRDAVVFPIYEGTSQIQALMAMKDNLLAAVKDPSGFVKRSAAARWRSLSARDPLERRVAGLRHTACQAQSFLLTRLAKSKFKGAQGGITAVPAAFRDWDPKRDFSLALLHSERLTGILTDAAVAELFWAQAQKDPARRPLLERWLERAEPRSRYLYDQITTTGLRLLAELETPAAEAAK